MKTVKILIALFSFLLSGNPSNLFAQTATGKGESDFTITGTLKCSSCDLKKEKGAGAQCSIYGCQYAFKTEGVTDANGKHYKKYQGKIYHIMLNDNSKELVRKENKKKKFEIKGKIFDEDRVIEISSFSEVL